MLSDIAILVVLIVPFLPPAHFAYQEIRNELAYRAATEGRYEPYTRAQYYALLEYHGLLGDVAVIEVRSDGTRHFKRNGRWCRFDRSIQ